MQITRPMNNFPNVSLDKPLKDPTFVICRLRNGVHRKSGLASVAQFLLSERRARIRAVLLTALFIMQCTYSVFLQGITGIHQGQSTLTVGGPSTSQITVPINWDVPFADSNYHAVCTTNTDPDPASAYHMVSALTVQIDQKMLDAMTVFLSLETSAPFSATVYCIGIGSDYSGPLHWLSGTFTSTNPAGPIPPQELIWNHPFADDSYRAVCTPSVSDGMSKLHIFAHFASKSASSMTVGYYAQGDGGSVDCIGAEPSTSGVSTSTGLIATSYQRASGVLPSTILTWDSAFANATYTTVCSAGADPLNDATDFIAYINTLADDSITVLLQNDDPDSGPVEVDCLAVAPSAPYAFTLSPNPLPVFPLTPIGTTSEPQTITLLNTGTQPLTDIKIATPAYPNDFKESDKCQNTTVAPGATCEIEISFAPTVDSTSSGILTVTGGGVTQSVTLSGTPGLAQATVSPTSLIFSSPIIVGQTSDSQTVTVTNIGNEPLIISLVTPPQDYTVTTNCIAIVAPSSSCTINVTLAPTVIGPLNETLAISDNAVDSPQRVALSGTGAAILLGSISLSSSANPSVTNQAVTFTAIINPAPVSLVTAVFFYDGTTLLGTGLPNTSGVATYKATALAVGSHNITASYQLASLPAPPISVVLQQVVTAAGAPDFSISASPLTATITRGQSTTFTFTVTPTNGFNSAVTFTCGTLPPEVTCNFAPATVTPVSGPATSILTITTTAPTVSLNSPSQQIPRSGHPSGRVAGVCLTTVLLISLPRRLRRRQTWLMLGIAGVLSVRLLTGCGAAKNLINHNTDPGTPAGTDTVTVTAITESGSSATSHDAAISVVIQ